MKASMIGAALPFTLALSLAGCNGSNDKAVANDSATQSADPLNSQSMGRPFEETGVAKFDEPWAMSFLPDDRLLVTEKRGVLKIVDVLTGKIGTVSGAPTVDYGGQGGLGDVVTGPNFRADKMIYLSWIEAGKGDTRGAVVGRGRLNCTQPLACSLDGLSVIWRQDPKVTGRGHYSHRIAFSPDGQYMFVSSGERQKKDPAQDLSNNLGSVLRLNPDGTVPEDNPFAERGGVSAQIWSYGHRNILGLAFAPNGNLWESEMGPKGGDEVNLIKRGKNYGWPNASNGVNYDGSNIPDHKPGDGYEPPEAFWTPSISPANLIYYTGSLFPEWQDSLLLGGLSGETLIRLKVDDQDVSKADQWDMGFRVRALAQGPQGAVWVLEDGSNGRLIKLTPIDHGHGES
ncbi:PQQ-dependent sugar dehydrogenase [Novosphingopyxis sp. YJ-S2-01]|uniref:PQQ-dependent sugar dehydrogenase n=1 Tax=Novosphingopyxis sp. YJ-S2-01 TaxID=2794021 RepID=UPI0018DD04B9|nr:PQQ-dependent sugar dehydrogenase [Novosphingopyxis sp. YJ-S2-01]MBH9537450.1 PQQ-dependent sugar dehydrogenase [Novosphingopyxis sp. YJ-S2-01]